MTTPRNNHQETLNPDIHSLLEIKVKSLIEDYHKVVVAEKDLRIKNLEGHRVNLLERYKVAVDFNTQLAKRIYTITSDKNVTTRLASELQGQTPTQHQQLKRRKEGNYSITNSGVGGKRKLPREDFVNSLYTKLKYG